MMKRRSVLFAAAGAVTVAAVAFCACKLLRRYPAEEGAVAETEEMEFCQVKEERTASMEERHHEAAESLAGTLSGMKADGEYQEQTLERVNSQLDKMLKEETGA